MYVFLHAYVELNILNRRIQVFCHSFGPFLQVPFIAFCSIGSTVLHENFSASMEHILL
jgi:hypothetical protein